MVRTQVQLTREQIDGLRTLSARTGRSLAALVRDAVDVKLAERSGADRWERAMGAVGAFESGSSEVSEQHDRELVKAYAGRLR